MGVFMRMIQMTLDEELITSVDDLVKELGKTRSEFTREALRDAIRKYEIRRDENRHREGYRKKPVRETELTDWEDEQAWGD